MTDGSTIKTTEYLDGFQYEDNLLEFFPTSEGYVKATPMSPNPADPQYSYNYVYNYTDHLGNVRISYAKDPQSGDLKVMEENNYYPYGLKHNSYASSVSLSFQKQLDDWGVILAPVTNNPYKYKYNGKELQDELSLNMYSMDMRQYDPAIARWVVMDPVIHHSMSPYNAFDNNPVFWADPSGADGESSDSGSNDYNPSGIRAMGIPIEAVMANSAGGGFMNSSTSNSANKQMAKASGTLDEMNKAIINEGKNKENSDDEGGPGDGIIKWLKNQIKKVATWTSNFKEASKLTKEWATGTGAEYNIYINDDVAKSMKDAPKVNEARDYWYNNAIKLNNLNIELTNYKGNFGLSEVIGSGLNPIQQFVGSMRIDILSDGDKLTFILSNTTSFKSLMYGVAPDWGRDFMRAGGNTVNIYIWSEKIKK